MIQATRFGNTLPDGGTIGVAAAASPYDNRSQVLRGVEWWETRGYRVKLGAGVWERDDYVAGNARTRADDLKARSRSLEDVLEERLGSLGVPVLYGLPLGHTKHLAALPLGVTCPLDADACTLTVDEPALR